MGDDVIAVSAADVTEDAFVVEILNAALTTATGRQLCDQQYPCLQKNNARKLCYTRYYDYYFCNLFIYFVLRTKGLHGSIPTMALLCITALGKLCTHACL